MLLMCGVTTLPPAIDLLVGVLVASHLDFVNSAAVNTEYVFELGLSSRYMPAAGLYEIIR